MEQELIHKPTVVCLTETWLQQGNADLISLPGYSKVDHYVRESRTHGGVSLYVKNGITHRNIKLNDVFTDDTFEGVAAVFKELNLVVACIYHVPKANVDFFFLKLEKLLSKITELYPKHTITICGDLNIDNLTDDPVSVGLRQLFQTFGLITHIKVPTRIGATSATAIDHIATNLEKPVIQVFENGISDHTAQVVHLSSCSEPKQRNIKTAKRSFSAANIDRFKGLLGTQDWNINEQAPADLAFNEFLNQLLVLFESCFPKKISTCKEFESYNKIRSPHIMRLRETMLDLFHLKKPLILSS